MTEQRVATLVVEVAGRKGNLDAILRALQQELRGAGQSAGQAADAIGSKLAAGSDKAAAANLKLLQAASRAATEQLKQARAAAQIATEQAKATAAQANGQRAATQLAAAQQKLAQAETQAALAAQRLATESARTEAAQTRAAAAAQRLAQAQQQGTASTRTSAGALTGFQQVAQGLQGTLGALGLSVGVAALIQFTASAGQAAVELERTQAVMRQLAGSQERYNEIVRLAEANQKLFGGSLNANLTPLNALLQMSNRTGAELQNLNRAAQLLLASSPGKAFGDAAFSLSEFLSNNGAEAALSLADQFNLNKQALAELATAGTSAEARLQGLFALLAEQGVTQDTLNASLTDNAEAYNRLGTAADAAKTRVGAIAATLGAPIAGGLAQSLEGLALLFDRLSGKGNVFTDQAAQAALAAGDFDTYVAGVEASNAQLDGFIASNAVLLNSLNVINPAFGLVAENVIRMIAGTEQLSESQRLYAAALAATGTAAPEAVAAAQAQSGALGTLETAFVTTGGALDGYREQVFTLAAANEGNLQAVTSLIERFVAQEISAAQLAGGLAGLEEATRAGEAAALAHADAQAAAVVETAAVTAVLDTGSLAAAAQAQALRDAAAAAFEQANAGRSLEQQARAAAQALFEAGGAGAAAANQLGNSTAPVDRLTAAYYRLIAAQQAAGAGGGALGGLGDRFADGGAAAATETLRARIASLNRFGGGAPSGGGGGRSGGGGRGGTSAAERERLQAAEAERKFQEQRLKDQQKINEELQAAETAHYQKLLDIQADYEEKNLAQQRENEVSKRRSRFDFYDSLTSSELPQDIQQSLSAAYEAAFAEAGRLSQEGKAALANDYLSLKQEQISAEQRFQSDLAAARKDGDKAEVDRLQRLAQLRRDAEAEELKQLVEGGDSNVASRDEAAADEQQRYVDKQGEIADKAEDAERRKVDASKRTLEQLQLETAELQKQADLLAGANRDRVAGGGVTPAGGGAAPAVAPIATPAAATPAAGGGAGETLAVFDAAVLGALNEVRSALDNVARAVGRLGRNGYTPGA